MQSEIKSIINLNSTYSLSTIFGYALNSVPGIEILGIGNKGRLLKEKLVYISRERGLKLRPLKYVISIESDLDVKNISLKEIELPILLILWHLAGIIPIESLAKCICVGEIEIDGSIKQPFMDTESLRPILESQKELDDYKIISNFPNDYLWNIQTKELLEDIPRLKYALN
tara:strand:- start:11470 stop:11982 length:513 start_codon:yes stop_codon:yes gene_type:complete